MTPPRPRTAVPALPGLPDGAAALAPGRTAPYGATLRDGGVNFAVWSDHAVAIDWCLFDADGREAARLALHGPDDGVWHGFLPGATAGLVYALRAHGPFEPAHGHRFNPHKLLLDPYAKEVVGDVAWGPTLYGHVAGESSASFDRRDSAPSMAKARVADVRPGRGAANPPRHATRDLVLYEVHVKNFGMRHPGIAPALRGRYAALAQPAAVAHFRRLGVNALSLLPVQWHLDEPALAARGAVNHWGYNTLGFFVPQPRWAQRPDDAAAVREELQQTVATLHDAGIEVLLDVVFNHTAEGGDDGPTLSFRGLDHASWYWLAPHGGPSLNWSGCGNTVRVAHPRVLQFVLDVLRHWVEVYGVDGFRFDLASILGRVGAGGFDAHAPFFAALAQDPVLARVHLIAEPWDAAPGGYQLGAYPRRWLEWNDVFRDTVRRHWLAPWLAAGIGHGSAGAVTRGEFARVLTASSDRFHHGGRAPTASVNFVSAHDGFTLADFTSYAAKRNHANGEDNRDGRDGEPCASLGPDGPSDDATVRARRDRVRRAVLATLLLAQGTPMLAAGDELGHTQQGNNNAYCQDTPLSWIAWAQADEALIDYVGALVALRREQPALRHARWFQVHAAAQHDGVGLGGDERSLTWLTPAGQPMAVTDWNDAAPHGLALRIDAAADDAAPVGETTALWLAFNPTLADEDFVLPPVPGAWRCRLDSARGVVADADAMPPREPGTLVRVAAASVVVWQQVARMAAHCAAPARRG